MVWKKYGSTKPTNCSVSTFPSYSGPAFIGACPKCIPMSPKVFEWMADGKHLSRQQLPLRLRYAMTIHKSQGQTLTKAVVDLGTGERVAGCTFVATSRVRSIDDIVFELYVYIKVSSFLKLNIVY